MSGRRGSRVSKARQRSIAVAALLLFGALTPALADGIMVPLRSIQEVQEIPIPVPTDGEGGTVRGQPREIPVEGPSRGTVEEQLQESIIILEPSAGAEGATEHLILKVSVTGRAEEFAWVIPFPQAPAVTREDPVVFAELSNYVRAQLLRSGVVRGEGPELLGGAVTPIPPPPPIGVETRRYAGEYEVAIVRPHDGGDLNEWLARQGYRTLLSSADVLEFYRQKGYVFACLKVRNVALTPGKPIELCPLRFTFKTGRPDGVFFPMKLTGLQKRPFDVNLYVFHGERLDGASPGRGYEHQSLRLKYGDQNAGAGAVDGGKGWADPQNDPFIAPQANRVPAVAALFGKLRPAGRLYLTNLEARELKPSAVRAWADDFWLFPEAPRPKAAPAAVAQPGGSPSAVETK